MNDDQLREQTLWRYAANRNPCQILYCVGEVEAFVPCKIGVTARVEFRLPALQTGNWRKLEVKWSIYFDTEDQARAAERLVLREYPRLQSEWVDGTHQSIRNLVYRHTRPGRWFRQRVTA